MKSYEEASKYTLPKKQPLLLRIDGKAFHTYTRSMQKPWDPRLEGAMEKATMALCREIDGSMLAYIQSDEISILVIDYQKPETGAWFDRELAKMVSVAASIAGSTVTLEMGKIATFDARAFVLEIDEVCNYFVWRQIDAIRNSVQSLGHAHFGPKQMHKLNREAVKEKLREEKNVLWEDLSLPHQRGVVLRRAIGERGWIVDREIPVFTKNRAYIERYLYLDKPELMLEKDSEALQV